jgi:serine/threonine-protein kinase
MSQTPTTLGKYQIIREIARSNDIVYEAYDPVMHRRVALKELAYPSGATDQQKEDRRSRFMREARAAGSLTHPNIVTIFEFGEDAGRHYIAMEYLDGRNLRNEIDTHGFLSQDRSLKIAGEVLKALEYAHNHGVIHRDIKPENIQLCEGGAIKITDFGIARLTFEPNLTMDGQVFGTPSYMSPEQVVGRDIDARSDLFSLGSVLYEMLTGQKAFAGDSVVSITYAIMNKAPDPPPQVHHAVWQVVAQALEKSPALRPASAAEMRVSLESALDALTTGQVPPTIQLPMAMPYPSQPPAYPYPSPGVPPVPYSQTTYPYPYPHQPDPTQGVHPQPPPYLPPGYQAGMPVAPIYYPPVPRKPLIDAATKAWIARFLGALIFLATLVVLLVVALNSVSKAVEQQRLSEEFRVRSGPVASEQSDMEAAAAEKLERARSDLDRDPRRARRLATEVANGSVLRSAAYLLIGDSYLVENNPEEMAKAWSEAMKLGERPSAETENRARKGLDLLESVGSERRRDYLYRLQRLCILGSETHYRVRAELAGR